MRYQKKGNYQTLKEYVEEEMFNGTRDLFLSSFYSLLNDPSVQHKKEIEEKINVLPLTLCDYEDHSLDFLTTINKAKQYKSEQIPAAEASADSIIQKAEAAKEARIAEAEGEVAKFNKMYEQYTLNPLITKKRIFYEAMEDVLPDLNVIISDGTTETMMPLQPFSEITTNGGEN